MSQSHFDKRLLGDMNLNNNNNNVAHKSINLCQCGTEKLSYENQI